MHEKNHVIRLEIPRLSARWTLVALFLALGTGDLASESVTLTTYYPAPSGVYTQMITTDGTWLARDNANSGVSVGTTNVPDPNAAQAGGADKMIIMGGNVGIGTTNPGNRLHVAGAGSATVDLLVTGRIQTGDAGASGGVWLSNGGNMFVGQNGTNTGFWTAGAGWNAFQITQAGNVGIGTAGPSYKLDVQGGDINTSNNIRVGQNAYVTGNVDVTGKIISRVVCAPIAYGANSGNICGAGAFGSFVTTVSGVYARYFALGGDDASPSGNGTALCCSCTAGVCVY